VGVSDRPVRAGVIARRRSPARPGRGGRPHAARRGLCRRPPARPRLPGHGPALSSLRDADPMRAPGRAAANDLVVSGMLLV